MKLYEIGNMASGVMVFPNHEDCYFELDISRHENWSKRPLTQEGMVFKSDQDDLYQPSSATSIIRNYLKIMTNKKSKPKTNTAAQWPMWPKIV
jgi:hypothetical protein